MKKTPHSIAFSFQGQTILEALLTLLFIAFVVIALIQFQGYLAYNNSLSTEIADATQLALSRTEVVHNFQMLIPIPGGYTGYSDINSGSAVSSSATTTFNISWVVTPFTSPTYKKVEVTVSWTDRRGNPQSLQLVTMVAGVDPLYSAAVM